ncbi:MAG: hypothetical protein Q4A01_04715 [Coriobacteriales bacterium]|nr:hypothetical protein [Coriobacteriales bacterium]
MRTGRRCGTDEPRERAWGIAWFVDDAGGYTTVAVAVAMLVSITLVFGVAATEWIIARSADVQAVCDATAMAGCNVVSAYCTIAQVVDACVLSMGLAGLVVMGTGLVASAVPGGQGAATKIVDAGREILDSRRRFATSAVRGLEGMETMLPLLIVHNASSCAQSNSEGDISYSGAAVPVPLQSQSDFSSLERDVSAQDLEDASRRLRDATRDADEARKRANDALRRAWEADCVNNPSCLSSRAASLAGLGGSQNPIVPSYEMWDFGMPIERSRLYYAERLAQESPDGSDIESVADSLARELFYRYALDEVYGAYYYEFDGEEVDLMLPHLARNAAEVRETWIYTDASWPCTDEGGVTLHASLECPGALGEFCGYASVADIEGGGVRECPVCRMSVGDLGRVASISTSATNGYEHYWQIIVEESQEYEAAKRDQAQAERRMRDAAEEGEDAFERALDMLRVPRPRLCPPGAYGCVGVVARGAGTALPSSLVSSFLSGQELPAGVAVSAAALAPDNSTDGEDVLSAFFNGIATQGGFSVGGVLDGICGLWGRLLVSYGSAYERLDGMVGGFMDNVDGVFGGSIGSWLKRRLTGIVGSLGLEPADMRTKKPVLVHTNDVLGRAGLNGLAQARQLVQAVPSHADDVGWAQALGVPTALGGAGDTFTIAELPVPGTNLSIPLNVDLARLGA